MQKINSDPIGIGDLVRAKHSDYWKMVDWYKVYPKAKLHAHVNFKISRSSGI